MSTERFDTIVIGAGQAGLATGYHLAGRRQHFVILDAHDRVGDVWRERFDSLRLYSPARYDGLPGWGIPAKAWSWPGKDEVADYFEAYAERFALPIRTGVTVDGLSRLGDRYVVTAGTDRFEADNVVVASGTWQNPLVPDLAEQLDPRIRQLHSSDYRNPSQLQDGPVLVVGCSHSGADIALEVSRSHRTTISGPVRGEVPFDIEGRAAHVAIPIMWFMANHVLTERTPIGRKMRAHVRSGGGPLLRVKRADLAEAGVEHFPAKVTSVRDGRPVLSDGTEVDVRNVVWCTGFRKDTSWIQIPVTGSDGWPEQSRGVSPDHPGLYFVGLPFLRAFASMLTGGVGRDAEYVAKHIARRRTRADLRPSAPTPT
ncbi:flavin-containing monooxygenase [Rhodococcus jostii]|uniref:Putative flavoprotein involved in K+ transport n=1 Tax=Rhodococcus jostii TaxID=132919 RepID=A0A1H5AY12_RHOJO|nr:NAD(P)-binding domain-containing protein [Rhodococcus jostii]SED47102.1 putative flavoprotein involved in K+ transport [Rhodococcus jostii]